MKSGTRLRVEDRTALSPSQGETPVRYEDRRSAVGRVHHSKGARKQRQYLAGTQGARPSRPGAAPGYGALVAHLPGGQGAAGSIPAIPTGVR